MEQVGKVVRNLLPEGCFALARASLPLMISAVQYGFDALGQEVHPDIHSGLLFLRYEGVPKMSPMIVKHKFSVEACSVSRNGIGMMQGVVEQSGWNIDDRIQVGFIEKASCILLRRTSDDNGFRLGYANARNKTGGRVYCVSFIRNYLQTLVELPKKNIIPLFLKNSGWTIALMLETIEWVTEEFSKAGANKVPKDTIGVYELLGNGDAVLRVGEGIIKDRISAHLTDKRFSPPTVKAFRYLALDGAEDGKILEKLRIEKYESEAGVLPRLQEIRA